MRTRVFVLQGYFEARRVTPRSALAFFSVARQCGVVLVREQVVYCAPSLAGEHGAPKRRLKVRHPGEAAMKQHAPRDYPQSRVTTHHPLE
jgi:hypothetical protein